jgi:hypothetical protein
MQMLQIIALASLLASSIFAEPTLAAAGSVTPQSDVIVGRQVDGRELLPTGKYITPTAAPGSFYQVLATGLRPDGNADADGATPRRSVRTVTRCSS